MRRLVGGFKTKQDSKQHDVVRANQSFLESDQCLCLRVYDVYGDQKPLVIFLVWMAIGTEILL